MNDMQWAQFGQVFSSLRTRLGRQLRRWLRAFGQNSSPLRSPEIDAYQALAQLRRRRAARPGSVADSSQRRGFGATAVDDPQVNLRITF
jgi:hypothetical protein